MAKDLLDDLTIRASKSRDKVYSLRDGNGLFLLVHPNGSKYFQFRTTLHGKPKLIQLGSYPDLSLKGARVLAAEKRQLIVEHKDPVIEAKLVKAQEAKKADATFNAVAEAWLAMKKPKIARSTYLKILQAFNANVYGKLGNYPISKIDNQLVRDCMLTMEKRGALELMEKSRRWIREVFNFALGDQLISSNPIPQKDLRLKKHEGEKYPHLKSLSDAGKLLRNLTDYAGSFEVSACVYLLMNFAQRPSELRCSKWVDFDLEKAIWTIPLEQSKTRKSMAQAHTVMLSKQAIATLKELKLYSGHSEYVFAARLINRPLSEATIRKAFRCNFTDYHIVPHGCRHFFSTQANESGLFRGDVIEAALSHKDENKIRGIYNEATYDNERRELFQWWSDQLEVMRDGAKVIPLKTA